MKFLLLITLFVKLFASEHEWEYERFNFYFENDLFSSTDYGYSYGGKISQLMYRPEAKSEWLKIPFISNINRANFISFALTQQIFTPDDLNATELIVDDRPYAGWLYFELGLHQSSAEQLDSLSIQIGVVGPSSGMEKMQIFVHEQLDSSVAKGWDNQLNDELGIQVNYQRKWRYLNQFAWGMDSSLVPYLGVELGNIAIKANAGALFRIGWNVPEDFGSNSIDEGGENGIPIRTQCLCPVSKPFSLTLSVAGGGTYVARDIFLDGNTFTDSHSVDKKEFKGYVSIGVSTRYKNYNLDYIQTCHSAQFESKKPTHSIGSFIFSYLF